MSTFNRFEDINAWQKARVLSDLIYQEASKIIFNNDKRLRLQMYGSSGSIMDNIAEGYGRGGSKEFKQYLWIAKGSASELRSQLYRSKDRNFIEEKTFNDLFSETEEIEKMIKGLINHIEASNFKGIKYK